MISCIVALSLSFNPTQTPVSYTLSLHDALPICDAAAVEVFVINEREAGVAVENFGDGGVPAGGAFARLALAFHARLRFVHWLVAAGCLQPPKHIEIGRASCRDTVAFWVGAVVEEWKSVG